MTRFQWMKEHGLEATEMGIISADVFAKLIRYEMVMNLVSEGKSMGDAILDVSIKTKVHEKTIERAIEWFRDR